MNERDFILPVFEDVEWKEFYLTDIFNIKRGNQNKMS